MKKIIEIIPRFKLAGAETMCENLITAIDKKEYEVIAISLYNYSSPITERLESKGYKIYYLNKKSGIDLKIFGKLFKIFKKEKPDMIHTHLYVLRYVLLPAKIACCKARIVHTVHNIASKEIKHGKLLQKIAFKMFNVIPVAISEIVQASIIKEYNLKEEKVPIIYNGINLVNCQKKECYDSSKIILHIGRFTEQKNHLELIEIFKNSLNQDKDLKLYLVGEGELKSEIKKVVLQEGLNDNVKFLGLLKNSYEVMNSADIFVMPSKWEGMPMTIIEAMGTGLPIIAYPVGGIPNMIENEKNGFLVKDLKEFSNKIIKLENDKELRENIGKRNKKDAARFSANTMAKKYCDLI